MSVRGLNFVREWVGTNIDLSFTYPYAAKRAQMLAMACRQAATTRSIGVQEIEDETGDLEETMMRILQTRTAAI